ncbi:Rho guanine nucleotide exchange factor 7, putative [Theobroma cacao]|uniref:Rho guanine nucleotide exchange factor 7, putative n=1 Tax=Theobroma cacao TaxID=3641 RepID=A0A061FNN5_THECC|nr:Rho guanine nucleotide exchange factor 7, putative [Theobroma cacao]
MVASSSSTSWETQMVSQEQINAFHTIDRNIFSSLVLSLRRDLGESIHVVAFLLWVEHGGNPARNLVFNIQPWSDALINALAKEAVLCLNCVKSDEFPDILQQASTINSMDAQHRVEQNLEASRFYGLWTRPTLPVFNNYNSEVGIFGDQNMGNKQVF